MSTTSDESTSDSTGFEMSVEAPISNRMQEYKRITSFYFTIGWVLLIVIGGLALWATFPYIAGQNVRMVPLNTSEQ